MANETEKLWLHFALTRWGKMSKTQISKDRAGNSKKNNK